MTLEARIGFVVLFFAIWCILGLIPWAIAAILSRGRGALLALPLALGGASSAGIAVPILGMRDVSGFFISMPSAIIGSALACIAFYGMRGWARRGPPADAEERREVVADEVADEGGLRQRR